MVQTPVSAHRFGARQLTAKTHHADLPDFFRIGTDSALSRADTQFFQ